MKLLSNQVSINLRKWLTLGIVMLVVSSTTVAFAQDQQDEDPAVISDPVQVQSSGTTIGSGPWNNSSATTPRVITRESSSGAAARPANGNTVLDPGDGPPNPDDPGVPFDSDMNLAFLVVGLVFAFVVYKKKFATKAEPLNK